MTASEIEVHIYARVQTEADVNHVGTITVTRDGKANHVRQVANGLREMADEIERSFA
jgi:hypothetical protein